MSNAREDQQKQSSCGPTMRASSNGHCCKCTKNTKQSTPNHFNYLFDFPISMLRNYSTEHSSIYVPTKTNSFLMFVHVNTFMSFYASACYLIYKINWTLGRSPKMACLDTLDRVQQGIVLTYHFVS